MTPMEEAREQATGNCGEVALLLLLRLSEQGVRCYLCHGYPLGTGGNALGKRYWHAWVELADGRTVLDYANGNRAVVAKSDYYRIGSIERQHVRRYSYKAAARAFVEWESYGPWVQPEKEPYQ